MKSCGNWSNIALGQLFGKRVYRDLPPCLPRPCAVKIPTTNTRWPRASGEFRLFRAESIFPEGHPSEYYEVGGANMTQGSSMPLRAWGIPAIYAGVAMAAALTFLAAASITPVAWAAAATLVSWVGGLITTTTCWLGVPAPAKRARWPRSLGTPVTPPATVRLPLAASIATIPEIAEGTSAPKSRSSTLVRVSGTRISALPLASWFGETGAAAAGTAVATLAAAAMSLVMFTRWSPGRTIRRLSRQDARTGLTIRSRCKVRAKFTLFFKDRTRWAADLQRSQTGNLKR